MPSLSPWQVSMQAGPAGGYGYCGALGQGEQLRVCERHLGVPPAAPKAGSWPGRVTTQAGRTIPALPVSGDNPRLERRKRGRLIYGILASSLTSASVSSSLTLSRFHGHQRSTSNLFLHCFPLLRQGHLLDLEFTSPARLAAQ